MTQRIKYISISGKFDDVTSMSKIDELDKNKLVNQFTYKNILK